VMAMYHHANLYHNMTTGRAVTGILHLLNQTSIDFYSRKQVTVEMATYGPEFVAGGIAVGEIIDLNIFIQYLGVRNIGGTYLIGNKRTVVDSPMDIVSRLHNRLIILLYHHVRRTIAAGVLHFTHLPGSIYPSNIRSKAWRYQHVCVMLKALLLWGR